MEAQQPHSVWMKNSAYLYDRLLVHKLKWPSLTFQWLPYCYENQVGQKSYRFIYGTHSSGGAQNQFIHVGQIILPKLRNIQDQPGQQKIRVHPVTKFRHQNQINKARCFPATGDQNWQGLIACRSDDGPICLFKKGDQYPHKLLEGNLEGGFALDWQQPGIVAGDFNCNLLYYPSLEHKPQTYSYVDKIQDTKFLNSNLILFVADNGQLSILDVRTNTVVDHTFCGSMDKKQVYSVAGNPFYDHVILTGGEDESVKIFDRRMLNMKLHCFQGHQGSVLNLDWSKTHSSIFASGSSDKKVKIWDLMRVGFQIPKDLGGTDELLFTHEGHQGTINDLSWNPFELLLGSVQQEDNTLQFYQMTNNIYELEYTEDMEYLKQQCFK